jgi:hypothetical protein
MPHHKTKQLLFHFCIGLIAFPLLLQSQPLQLKIAGDSISGFHVDVFDNNQLLVTNTEEFSIDLFNTDYSTIAHLDWKGETWSGNEHQLILQRTSYIKAFDANLTVTITYEIINENLVRKSIDLFQPSMPGLLYTLKETSRPAKTPEHYVTFEYDSFPGGMVHEMYPVAGFITQDKKMVGFLTDAGYKNHYTRNTRRRFSGEGGGFVGMRTLPDPELLSVADSADRAAKHDFIRYTFGEMYELDAGTQTTLELPDHFQKEGHVDIKSLDANFSITGTATQRAAVDFIAPFKDQQVYTISFLCKGDIPVALKLFRLKNGRKTIELEDGVKYIDHFPTGPDEWKLFKGSILVPYIGHDSVSMLIGTESGKAGHLQIKDLKIIEHQPDHKAYNILPIGEKTTKTTYLFVEPWTSHQQFMIDAQSRLAEGLGFQGSLIEKMVYANFNMLTWITDINDFTPFNVPNMNYAPDMYNRDCFFAGVATYNKDLNLSLWSQWGKTQTTKGAIGTIITPRMGSVEVKDNEATIEWLIWAMLNKRRFGITLPQDKIEKAVAFVMNEFDEDRDGICLSHFPLNQLDVIDYNPKTDRLCVNQGMLVVALRTIKELGFDIDESYIAKAENGYRNFYDAQRKHLIFDRNYPDVIALTDLEPEFFSLWLFNKPMLTDEMVKNHLDQIPVFNKVPDSPHPEYGTTAPICIRLTHDAKGYAYFDGPDQPFGKFGEENYSNGKNEGYYYNGGSWFRAEYCAYVVGLKHGWTKARDRMDNRVWAEIYLNPKWPFSKEFIPTQWTTTDSWWVSTKGLCWNVFMLMADEVAGLRTPDMDPDYRTD